VWDVIQEPYVLTLWTYVQLREIEQFESFQRESERLDTMTKTAIAAWGDADLRQTVVDEFLSRVAATATPETVEDEAAATIARHDVVDAQLRAADKVGGWIYAPEPPL
jgi:hypothetical protein